MEIRHLHAFLAIAEERNFGRAAARLHLTQPALTKRIQALEAELGASLFERGRMGAELTAFGTLFRPDAARLAAEAEAVLSRARRAAEGRRGRLAVGFGYSSAVAAPRLVAAFRRLHPEVEVTLNDFSSAEQYRRLLTGDLDVGFARPPDDDRLIFLPVLAERLALVVPEGRHEGDIVDLDALNREGFVALTRGRGPGLAEQIRRWCAKRDFHPRIIQEADDIQTVLAVVAAGIGAALLPGRSGSAPAGVRVISLEGEETEWAIGLVRRRDHRDAVVERFLTLVRGEIVRRSPP